jgi:threonine dehydrogenase-like Zn-dependent dehydrogenase
VGLAALMLAKSMGANKLIGVDVVEERLEVTQKLGLADHVTKAGAGNVDEIRSLTGGYGVERAVFLHCEEEAHRICNSSPRTDYPKAQPVPALPSPASRNHWTFWFQ